MKLANCARCGQPIMVAEAFNIDEDMDVCLPCEGELLADYHARHPETLDTEPL